MDPKNRGIERLEREAAPQAPLIYNWFSMEGAVLVVIGMTIALFLFVVELFTEQTTGYSGLTLLLPLSLALLGVALFFFGLLRERRRQRRGKRSRFVSRWVIDPLGIVRSTGLVILLLGISVGTFALFAGGAGSVAVVEFSESNTFCSDVCHAVMAPEATAHQTTAHSRLDCVECHVGAGAEGFLEAKIGGMRQLWSVATNSVHPPIQTPIDSTAIGRHLCERCHSPEREVGYKTLNRSYYLSGLEDSPIRLAMLVKVGSGHNGLIPGWGIHYHMVTTRKVEFIARDRQRQDIAWIRVTEAGGEVHEYESRSEPLTPDEKASLEPHTMNCIDCHSRPAHAFRSPVDSVNEALRSGRLPSDIYYMKGASVRALDGGYESVDEAMAGIEQTMQAFYEEEDPDVLEDRPEDVASAVEALREIYRQTIFPEMKANWTTHPDNIGHTESPGCFRCHNDDLVNGSGEPIFSDCRRCHSILAQDQEAITAAADLDQGMGFAHPQDGEFIRDFKLCSKCHTGGREIYE